MPKKHSPIKNKKNNILSFYGVYCGRTKVFPRLFIFCVEATSSSVFRGNGSLFMRGQNKRSLQLKKQNNFVWVH